MRTLNAEEIAVEIVYRKIRFYYGRTSVMDLRKFLEPKLKQLKMSEEHIQAWKNQATMWLSKLPESELKSVVQEYARIQLVK